MANRLEREGLLFVKKKQNKMPRIEMIDAKLDLRDNLWLHAYDLYFNATTITSPIILQCHHLSSNPSMSSPSCEKHAKPLSICFQIEGTFQCDFSYLSKYVTMSSSSIKSFYRSLQYRLPVKKKLQTIDDMMLQDSMHTLMRGLSV